MNYKRDVGYLHCMNLYSSSQCTKPRNKVEDGIGYYTDI